MAITFHADLLGVDLEIFAEHVNAALPTMANWEPPVSGAVLLAMMPEDREEAESTEQAVYRGHLVGVPNPTKKQLEIKADKAKDIERIARRWIFRWFEEVTISPVPEGIEADKVDIDGNITPMTSIVGEVDVSKIELRASVYYRDRLRLVVDESEGSKWTKHFVKWLEKGWGEEETGAQKQTSQAETTPHLLEKRDPHGLVPRYNRVAHLIADGKDSAEIAKLLGPKKKSIDRYRKEIASHFDVSSTLSVLRAKLQELGYGNARG